MRDETTRGSELEAPDDAEQAPVLTRTGDDVEWTPAAGPPLGGLSAGEASPTRAAARRGRTRARRGPEMRSRHRRGVEVVRW